MDCGELERMCRENACRDAGGEYSQGLCIQGANFSLAYYNNASGECAGLGGMCKESDGMIMPPRNASCCGPVFVLLAVLGFAASSPRFK